MREMRQTRARKKIGKELLKMEQDFLSKILKMDLTLLTTRMKLHRTTLRLNEKTGTSGSWAWLKKNKGFQKIGLTSQRMEPKTQKMEMACRYQNMTFPLRTQKTELTKRQNKPTVLMTRPALWVIKQFQLSLRKTLLKKRTLGKLQSSLLSSSFESPLEKGP